MFTKWNQLSRSRSGAPIVLVPVRDFMNRCGRPICIADTMSAIVPAEASRGQHRRLLAPSPLDGCVGALLPAAFTNALGFGSRHADGGTGWHIGGRELVVAAGGWACAAWGGRHGSHGLGTAAGGTLSRNPRAPAIPYAPAVLPKVWFRLLGGGS